MSCLRDESYESKHKRHCSHEIYACCRNTTIIIDSRETRITFDGKSAKLLVPSATVKHTGTYKVKFINSGGSAESSAEVVVKGTSIFFFFN